MEKIWFAGKIVDIKQGINTNNNPYLTFKVSRKNIWLDKQTNAWKEQIISRTMITSSPSHLEMYQSGLLKLNDFVVIQGTVSIEQYTNSNNETKSSIKINPITIDNISWIDLQIQ